MPNITYFTAEWPQKNDKTWCFYISATVISIFCNYVIVLLKSDFKGLGFCANASLRLYSIMCELFIGCSQAGNGKMLFRHRILVDTSKNTAKATLMPNLSVTDKCKILVPNFTQASQDHYTNSNK